jgi:hypothetical protein
MLCLVKCQNLRAILWHVRIVAEPCGASIAKKLELVGKSQRNYFAI